MDFEQIASGSTGNFYVVTARNGKRLIIECGIRSKKMLEALGHNSKGIEGCLVSHAHKDHCKSMSHVMNSGIDVYANNATFESQALQDHHRANVVENKTLITKMPTFSVYCFDVNHDVDALGFVVRCDGEFLLFATDTSHLTQQFQWAFNIVAIECNYDKNILQNAVENDNINESHAKRLLESHMEKSVTMRYLKKFVNMKDCREIHLLHMSRGNIDAEKTRAEFERKFLIDTIIIGS